MKYFLMIFLLAPLASALNGQQASGNLTLPTIGSTVFSSCSGDTILQGSFTSQDNVINIYVLPNTNPPTANTCPDLATLRTAPIPPSVWPNPDSTKSNQATVTNQALLEGLGASVCKPDGQTGWLRICVYGTTTNSVSGGNYQYDTTPTRVTIENVKAGNKQISFDIKSKKVDEYQICYGDEASITSMPGMADCTQKTQTSKTTRATLSNLTNDTPYFFRARALDSEWSNVEKGTPVHTDGFSEAYDGAANPYSFSCTQSSNAPGVWVLMLGLLAVLRSGLLRRKGNHLAMLILIAPAVLADLGQVNVGIIGTPYRPNLDASTKSDGTKAFPLYGCMFNNKLLPLMGVEVDVHLDDSFGSVQLGMGASYAYAGGKALLVQNSQATCGQSEDAVSLQMLHLRPQITYILDPWVEDFPLVPYVRGGLVAVGYMFRYQGALDKESSTHKPMGFVFGWEAAFGLMLALDFMEPSVSKTARSNGVYQHIYLKAEAAYSPINNFYQHGLDFSPAWPTNGFPLTLNFGLVFELP